MNHDAPLVSRFLGPLMTAKSGDSLGAAEKFILIALEGYDEEPYACRTIASEILADIKTKKLSQYVL